MRRDRCGKKLNILQSLWRDVWIEKKGRKEDIELKGNKLKKTEESKKEKNDG